MANNVDAFLERLTAAGGEYNQAKVSKLAALDAVYLDIRPEVARLGQTIRVYYPDVSPFTDQAANDWTPEDLNPSFVDVPFGQRPGKAILVRDFEQFQTSTDIIEQFIDPNYKRAQEFANQQVFNLLTPANFGAYPAVSTAFPARLGITDAKNLWNILTRNKIPINGPDNASILYHTDLHANTLIDPQWTQESFVSATITRGIREDAADMPGQSGNLAFRFARRDDQQGPTGTSANLTGTVAVTNGSTAVVGTTTAFTTQLGSTVSSQAGNIFVGAWITIGSDTVSYPVISVTDDTHATLGQPYGGTTASGATLTRVTYTGVAMHRWAIALAVRPLEIVNEGNIHSRLLMIKGLPMRLMLSYQHLKSGWLMSLDYGMVAKVIRPDFGILFNA